jgi:dTDP-4-dehydrorhamnose 3,5-epimerase
MSASLTVSRTSISGLAIVQRHKRGDDRGSLTRLFCANELAAAGWTKPIAQINHTVTIQAGTLRGLHFQLAPHAEMKLVTCIRGSVLDIGLDLREGSQTFLQHHREVLSADNQRALLIPEGCAHGFQALTDNVEMLYLHSNAYNAEAERGLNPLDAALGIEWPKPVTIMSARDKSHPLLANDFKGIVT